MSGTSPDCVGADCMQSFYFSQFRYSRNNRYSKKARIAMDSEKLIESVKKYKFLYDQEDPKYSDTERKEIAWMEIGQKLGHSDKHCKRTWCNLREAFRRHLKKRKQMRSDQVASKRRRWKYEQEMAFIVPFFTERNSVASATIDEDVDDSPAVEEVPSIPDVKSDVEMIENVSETESLSSSDTENEDHTETSFAVLMKYLLEKNDYKSHDDIDTFFNYMATTVKKFSPRNRIIAKAKVFNIISDIEVLQVAGEEALIERSLRNQFTSIPEILPSHSQKCKPRMDCLSNNTEQ